MINRIPKRYRHKYRKELGKDEKIARFAFKAAASAALFFTIAIGVDVYRFLY